MRIVENTPERLVLRDRTWWISVICFGAAAVLLIRFAPADRGALVGAVLFVVFGLAFLRGTDLVFDKVQTLCTLRRLDVLRIKRLRFAFEDIRDFRVEVEIHRAKAIEFLEIAIMKNRAQHAGKCPKVLLLGIIEATSRG